MAWEVAKRGAAAIAILVACCGANAADLIQAGHDAADASPVQAKVKPVGGRKGALHGVAAHRRHWRAVTRSQEDTEDEPEDAPESLPSGAFSGVSARGAFPGESPGLSYQEERVSELARQAGDAIYLMVDKALGKIILFANGQPIFSGPALTGQSPADQLPPGALAEKFSDLTALAAKVTAAGRFTVARVNDKEYGTLLDINEFHGKDWGIAIHPVYLGNPSEQREARLRSPNEADKHITFGCINVTPEAFRFLMRELPDSSAIPLYILPRDETRTAAYFAPGGR